jgi:hypothetical protein
MNCIDLVRMYRKNKNSNSSCKSLPNCNFRIEWSPQRKRKTAISLGKQNGGNIGGYERCTFLTSPLQLEIHSSFPSANIFSDMQQCQNCTLAIRNHSSGTWDTQKCNAISVHCKIVRLRGWKSWIFGLDISLLYRSSFSLEIHIFFPFYLKISCYSYFYVLF